MVATLPHSKTHPTPDLSTERTVELWIFRHGQTDWNKEGRIQGHLDVPLNDEGRRQASRLIGPLRRLEIEVVVSSDLSRARETAEIIASSLKVPVHPDPRLREVHLGKLQGLTKIEIEALHGYDFRTKLKSEPLSDADVARLGSETGEQVLKRALDALAHHLQLLGVARVAVATHGGVLRHLIQKGMGNGVFPPSVVNGVLYPFEAVLRNGGELELRLKNLTRI